MSLRIDSMAYISDLDETYDSIINILTEYQDRGILQYAGKKKNFDVYFVTTLTRKISEAFNVSDLFYYIIRLDHATSAPFSWSINEPMSHFF